jgi:hypothetical protein
MHFWFNILMFFRFGTWNLSNFDVVNNIQGNDKQDSCGVGLADGQAKAAGGCCG